MNVHFSSQSDVWSTPQATFDKLQSEFGFDLDVCALPENAKCQRYFTPEQDGHGEFLDIAYLHSIIFLFFMRPCPFSRQCFF